MTLYTWSIMIEMEVDTPRSPDQIRNALVHTAPTVRQALKAALRSQLAKDPTGETKITKWHVHLDSWLKGALFAPELEDVGVDISDGVRSYQEEPEE